MFEGSILLILPFVLFAPLAGWIADRFSKKTVITWALFGQLIGLGVLGCALYSESLEFSLAGFFILSTQSAFFSPVKKGIKFIPATSSLYPVLVTDIRVGFISTRLT
mgnify:CR=1 FL=1